MNDTISRQAAIDLVRDVCDAVLSGCGSHYDGDDEVYDDLLEVDAVFKCNKEIRIALANLPSAQPERIRGWWTPIPKSDRLGCDPVLAGFEDPVVGYDCSVCGEVYEAEVMGETLWNYCPNCGADMRN